MNLVEKLRDGGTPAKKRGGELGRVQLRLAIRRFHRRHALLILWIEDVRRRVAEMHAVEHMRLPRLPAHLRPSAVALDIQARQETLDVFRAEGHRAWLAAAAVKFRELERYWDRRVRVEGT